ncbi:MAG: hypothetical protein GX621_07435, partial [Pirellulaceae bacterium]|nr:hypothetical protein [Pirellulaceae bacterium]
PVKALLIFNGGTLEATADAPSFVEKLSSTGETLVVVKSGGAKINSGIYAIGIDVALTEDAVSTGGGLTKLGDGTLTLSGANTYTGATLVEAGTLALGAAGSIADSASIIVAADATLDVTAQAAFALADGQTLGGNGDVIGDVTAVDGSTIAPGLSIGTLTVTGDLAVGGTLAIEYNSNTPAIDLLNVSGALDLSSATLSFSDLGESTLTGEPYVFATYGTLAGAPAFEPIGTPTGYVVDYAYEGNKVALVLIPEPSALALLAGLLALLAGCRARR